MSKFGAVQRQLEEAAGRSKPAPVTPIAKARPVAEEIVAPPAKKPGSREGKIHIGAYLHPDFKRSLRLVQAQTDMDVQALLAKALNDLFRAHNVPVVEEE